MFSALILHCKCPEVIFCADRRYVANAADRASVLNQDHVNKASDVTFSLYRK